MFRPDESFNLFICGLCAVMAMGLLLRPLNSRKILLACILALSGIYTVYHSADFIPSDLSLHFSLLQFTLLWATLSLLWFIFISEALHGNIRAWDTEIWYTLSLPFLFSSFI